jgi:hypothetical protein
MTAVNDCCRSITQALLEAIKTNHITHYSNASWRVKKLGAPHTACLTKAAGPLRFWCISQKARVYCLRYLYICFGQKACGARCGPISGCPADLTSPPPLTGPLVAADGHADGAFDSALGGRNDGQVRSRGPQTDVAADWEDTSVWTVVHCQALTTTGAAPGTTEPTGNRTCPGRPRKARHVPDCENALCAVE